MAAISLEDTSPIITIEDILSALRSKLAVESDEEVFIEAYKAHNIQDGRAEYRVFKAQGSRFLPPCVERFFIDKIKSPVDD